MKLESVDHTQIATDDVRPLQSYLPLTGLFTYLNPSFQLEIYAWASLNLYSISLVTLILTRPSLLLVMTYLFFIGSAGIKIVVVECSCLSISQPLFDFTRYFNLARPSLLLVMTYLFCIGSAGIRIVVIECSCPRLKRKQAPSLFVIFVTIWRILLHEASVLTQQKFRSSFPVSDINQVGLFHTYFTCLQECSDEFTWP